MESKSSRLISFANKKQIIASRDAHTLGIPRNYLPRLVRQGLLKKIGRGLYRSKTSPVTEHISLIETRRWLCADLLVQQRIAIFIKAQLDRF